MDMLKKLTTIAELSEGITICDCLLRQRRTSNNTILHTPLSEEVMTFLKQQTNQTLEDISKKLRSQREILVSNTIMKKKR